MNNEAYLQLEGAGFLEDALLSYHAARGSDLLYEMEKALKAHALDIAACDRGKVSSFFWDYVVYRLYVALSMVKGNKAGLLCVRPLVEGLMETLKDMPLSLKTLSLKRNMQGSYLVLGPEVKELTPAHVRARLTAYADLDRKHAGSADRGAGLNACIAESMTAMAADLDAELSPSFLAFLVEETKAFMAHVSESLAKLTPQAIHKNAKAKTHGFSLETYKALYPSLALTAAMAAGMLVMFA